MRPRDDPAGKHHHGADGNLLGGACLAGLLQGLAHEILIAVQIDEGLEGLRKGFGVGVGHK